jgi:hypothetical protein
MPQTVTITNDTGAIMLYSYTVMAGNMDCSANNAYLMTIQLNPGASATIPIPEENIKAAESETP